MTKRGKTTVFEQKGRTVSKHAEAAKRGRGKAGLAGMTKGEPIRNKPADPPSEWRTFRVYQKGLSGLVLLGTTCVKPWEDVEKTRLANAIRAYGEGEYHFTTCEGYVLHSDGSECSAECSHEGKRAKRPAGSR